MPDIYEIIGYIASLIVLISLLMSSVKRLRWINLIGASLFSLYGFFIQAWPVAIMNFGIVLINSYYLIQMYSKKDYFTLLAVDQSSEYFHYFIEFYKNNIDKYMDVSEEVFGEEHLRLFVLRNTVPAGLFVCKRQDTKTLEILLDYATPVYRDFKMGHFVFTKEQAYFRNLGYKKFVTKPGSLIHASYLGKMGFEETVVDGKKIYIKQIG